VGSGTRHRRKNVGNAEARTSDGKGEKGLDEMSDFTG